MLDTFLTKPTPQSLPLEHDPARRNIELPLSEEPPVLMKGTTSLPVLRDQRSKSATGKGKRSILTRSRKTLKKIKKPTYMCLIGEALQNLRDPKGLSVRKIKNYLNRKYGLDMKRSQHYINKNIKRGLERGIFSISDQRIKLSPACGDVARKGCSSMCRRPLMMKRPTALPTVTFQRTGKVRREMPMGSAGSRSESDESIHKN